MQRLSKSLYNLPVVGLHHGGQIAFALEPIINPNNLKILGWYCKGPAGKQVLLAEEVRSLGSDGIMVNDDSALAQPQDLTRHQEVLDLKFQLLGKPVKTAQSKIGKVSDFTYDESSMFINQLYVEPPLVKLFGSHDTRIISRNQITEITDAYILVEDADEKVKEPLPEQVEEPEPEVPLAETA